MNAISSFSYSYREAEPSRDREGRILSQGKKVTRLQIGKNSPVYVAALKLDHWVNRIIGEIGKKLGYFIELQKGEEKILVNINSLAKRLHIKRSTILKREKEGTLSSDWLTQKAQQALLAASQYEKVASQLGKITHLSSKDLMKEVRRLIKGKDANHLYAPLAIQGGDAYYMKFDQDKQAIDLWKLEQEFAHGGFGRIHVFSKYLEDHSAVFKRADQGQRAQDEIKREYDILQLIHQNGAVWGIQKKPYEFIQIKIQEKTPTVIQKFHELFKWRYLINVHNVIESMKPSFIKESESFGYLGQKYEGNYNHFLDKKLDLKFEDVLMDFHQLFGGLASLENSGILHGDLKPQNILFRLDSDGTRLLHIADFGGAVVSNDPNVPVDRLSGFNRSYTSGYCHYDDLREAEKKAKENDRATVIEIEQKRDVFSLGLILYNVYHPLIKKDVPDEIKTLMKSMVDHDYTKRPTAQKAFQRYNHFLKSQHPNVYAKIQEKIQKEYPGSSSLNG